MNDFYKINVESTRKAVLIYPDFLYKRSSDLMIRGGDFYAVWDGSKWNTDFYEMINCIDSELMSFGGEYRAKNPGVNVQVQCLTTNATGQLNKLKKFMQNSPDNYVELDGKIMFLSDKIDKKDYCTKHVSYDLVDQDIPCWNSLMSVLYTPENRHKIEWCIGCVVAGETMKTQKFLALYGEPGSGKSTVLDIIAMLFEGYCGIFDAKGLTSTSNQFATAAFASNPLVMIQHDTDLSRIEDNTRLNSITSHEKIQINEKYKSQYSIVPRAMLFLGTNNPIRITDSKSGILRRLIDASTTGTKIPIDQYVKLMGGIKYELGGIAYHCKQVYTSAKHAYDKYIPVEMLDETNDIYNFIANNLTAFIQNDPISLKTAWVMFKDYADFANVRRQYCMKDLGNEMRVYYESFKRHAMINGEHKTSVFVGFKKNKFVQDFNANTTGKQNEIVELADHLLVLESTDSILDDILKDQPAQYATAKGTPKKMWKNVTTTLKDLDTRKLHYVKLPQNHIVIDFDLKDANGNKSRELNLAAASKWPDTYAEYSKSGAGVHLHYIYDGDVSKLSNTFAEGIEIKVYTGDSALRRQLSTCSNGPIMTISSGLPTKEVKNKMVDWKQFKTEKELISYIANVIKKCLNKEVHPGTKPSVDLIKKVLDDAYASGKTYDVSFLRGDIATFAGNSTHHANECMGMVSHMKFKSADYEEVSIPSADNDQNDKPIIIYDIEVFPNVWMLCYQVYGTNIFIKLINPTVEQIVALQEYNLIGFNNTRYDDIITYRGMVGDRAEGLYALSRGIITGTAGKIYAPRGFSYLDLYDVSSKKQSLKKWEIELGLDHDELGWDWNTPLPADMWDRAAEYCCHDVAATTALYEHLLDGDIAARKMLASIAGLPIATSNNNLSAAIIFGKNQKPQSSFNYRDMGASDVPELRSITDVEGFSLAYPEYCMFQNGKPYFPGYTFSGGKSVYRGIEVGEGGYVYANLGTYYNVDVEDVASMHPSSIIAENLFGDEYTRRFAEIVQARLCIKHKDYEGAAALLDGKLVQYMNDETVLPLLSKALKIVINSVYGLTAAKFPNRFRDPRNVDNIVAKRGALFMINLRMEVEAMGYTVIHIKTDSIKIENADERVINFVRAYGRLYGYNFETEDILEKMCLVNKSVYVAKNNKGEWEATGTQFAVPYVFKTLFTHEDITFEDLCVVNSVSGDSALWLDFNENLPEGEHDYKFVGKVGQFVPIMPFHNAGVLYRKQNDKYYAVSGSTGYRFFESSFAKQHGCTDAIDLSYFDTMVTEARASLAECGATEDFYK